jgi:hypothetical protein
MFKATVVALFGTFLLQTVSFAQIYVKSTGVGVGTSTPAAKLHVSGKTLIESNDADILTFKNPNASAPQLLSFYKNGFKNLWMGLDEGIDFQIVNEKANGNIQLKPKSGRVYIEASYDNTNIGGTLMLRHPGKVNAGQNMDWAIYNMKDGYGNGLSFWGYGSSTWGRVLTLGDNGNVSIGNMIPNNTHKLQVAGAVDANEYRVYGQQFNWPDYVFDTTIYKLPSLPEVETYLKQNRHLPEVPSAETVKKEGLNLGENQAVLLKKIEELTLYVIEQNKKLEEQNEKLALLEKKLIDLMDKNK